MTELNNVYDFDGTIYDGDSTLDFYRFCIFKQPKILLYLPFQILGAIEYTLKVITKTQYKEKFYSFLRGVKDIDSLVIQFWNKYDENICSWYRKVADINDVVVSASPSFLLRYECERLNVKLLCSQVDKVTGKYEGLNCFGEEKIRRLKETYGEDVRICNFYTDSASDLPLAQIAEKSFLVTKKTIVRWK